MRSERPSLALRGAGLEAELADPRGVPLARIAAGGELVDLTEDDIRLWMFWLGLDYILNR